MPDSPITIVDELELLPGQLDDFMAAFETEYRPGAEDRGMKLAHLWVTPPFERPEGGTTLLIIWQVEGAAGFWAMRSQSGAEDVARWWKRCDAFTVRRSRRIAAEAADLPSLAQAGHAHR